MLELAVRPWVLSRNISFSPCRPMVIGRLNNGDKARPEHDDVRDFMLGIRCLRLFVPL